MLRPPPLQGLPDRLEEAAGLHRFGEAFEGPQAEGLHRGLHGQETRDEHGHQVGPRLPGLGDEPEPVAVGQFEVRQQDPPLAPGGPEECLVAPLEPLGGDVRVLQRRQDGVEGVGVVVHDEDRPGGAGGPGVPANPVHQPGGLHRLAEVVGGPALQSLLRRFDGREAGEDEHREAGVAGLHLPQGLQAPHALHLQVEQGQMELAAPGRLHPLLAAGGGHDLVAPVPEQVGDRLPDEGLVVHQKDAALHPRYLRRARVSPALTAAMAVRAT